jgi:hypothetical protein
VPACVAAENKIPPGKKRVSGSLSLVGSVGNRYISKPHRISSTNESRAGVSFAHLQFHDVAAIHSAPTPTPQGLTDGEEAKRRLKTVRLDLVVMCFTLWNLTVRNLPV